MHLSSLDITILLSSISLMLLGARLVGELIKLIKLPIVIGEIIVGIILGPTILGTLFPDFYNTLFVQSASSQIALNGIVSIALVMLMLVTGLELDLSVAFSHGKKSTFISLFGMVLPFILGFITVYFFPKLFVSGNHKDVISLALFIGIALSVTALPVIARTLIDLNILKTEVGVIILTSAMITDIFGWLFFSGLLGSYSASHTNSSLTNQLALLIIFIVTVLLVGRKLFNWLIPIISKHATYPGGLISFIFICGFLGASFTEYIGVHSVLGVFIVGMAIGDSVHLKEDIREMIQQFATNIFAPLFFVSIGLRINFIENFDPLLISLLIFLSFIGKAAGSYWGARFGGVSKDESFIIGFGMNSYGAMQIILSLVALQANLIDKRVFVALVVLALVTSITSAPIMKYFIKRSKKNLTFVDLLKGENIFFSNSKTKNEIIAELCKHASLKNKLNYEIVLQQVMNREEQMSTGLVNYFAIPHARLKIQYPIVAMAVCKEEIEFESLDGLPVKVAVLLLTPSAEPELQLKLLADISKKFNTDKTANNISSSKTIDEIISIVKHLS